MKKEGILFQGLCIQERQRLDFVEEEGFYYEKRKPYQKTEKKYADVTYFLLYIISKNQMCREMVQDMETQWLEYLRERAGNSVYQGEGFWDSLSGEEKICAEAVLGLLEDIRGDEEERAELLQRIISKLPEMQRRRFLLHYEYEMTYKEIGKIEHCSQQSVGRAVNAAREKIKAEMKKYLSA